MYVSGLDYLAESVYRRCIYKPLGCLIPDFTCSPAARVHEASWPHRDGCWLSASHWPQVPHNLSLNPLKTNSLFYAENVVIAKI